MGPEDRSRSRGPVASLDTIADVLVRRLAADPARIVCYLVSHDGEVEAISATRLLQKSMAFAERYGPSASGRKIVGVCLYHGLDCLAAFLGGLLSGHIPTMLPPPSPRMEVTKYSRSLAETARLLRLSLLVADSRVLKQLEQEPLEALCRVDVIDPAFVPDSGQVRTSPSRRDDVALLQHSSGTTGLQKGVALSHRAILVHNEAYRQRLGMTREDVIVSWLPLYHDMGLIACFLLPLLEGAVFVEMSPFEWVLRPVLLLEQIARHRGTLCWLPNFAFTFMANNIRTVDPRLDISSIKAWVNCSEPVSHSSHAAFVERFARNGVHWEQITASYAMAENVFAVTQSRPAAYRKLAVCGRTLRTRGVVELSDDDDATVLVSCGSVVHGTQVSILGDAGQILGASRVGELGLRGEYCFDGYFRREDLTRDAFTADGWYRTGDLGFVHDGEVYVTGRKKDLIIIQGRNLYPQDIESIAGAVAGVIPGRVVAFGIRDERVGTERLIVLFEAADPSGLEAKRLALKIRGVIAEESDCAPSDVRAVPPRWLVKSTSGKVARSDNRRKYVDMFESPSSRGFGCV